MNTNTTANDPLYDFSVAVAAQRAELLADGEWLLSDWRAARRAVAAEREAARLVPLSAAERAERAAAAERTEKAERAAAAERASARCAAEQAERAAAADRADARLSAEWSDAEWVLAYEAVAERAGCSSSAAYRVMAMDLRAYEAVAERAPAGCDRCGCTGCDAGHDRAGVHGCARCGCTRRGNMTTMTTSTLQNQILLLTQDLEALPDAAPASARSSASAAAHILGSALDSDSVARGGSTGAADWCGISGHELLLTPRACARLLRAAYERGVSDGKAITLLEAWTCPLPTELGLTEQHIRVHRDPPFGAPKGEL